MKKIKYVLFDCWDTVIKFEEIYKNASLKVVFDHFKDKNKYSFDEILAYDSKFLYDYYSTATFEVSQTAIIAYLCESLGIELDISYKEAARLCTFAYKGELVPGFLDFISFLKENNIHFSILSNTIQEKDDLDELILRNFDQNPFDQIICSSTYAVKKPDPRFYLLACKKLNLNPEEVAFIGDNILTDITGANLSKMQAFYFNWKRNIVNDDLKKQLIYTEFTSYSELINLFKDRI